MVTVAIIDYCVTFKEELRGKISQYISNGLYSAAYLKNEDDFKLYFKDNDADIIVICAGYNKELAYRSIDMVIEHVTMHGKHPKILIAGNLEIREQMPHGKLSVERYDDNISGEELLSKISHLAFVIGTIRSNWITFDYRNYSVYIRKSDIYYVKPEGRRAIFHNVGKNEKVVKPLTEIAELLGPDFAFCHKSYLVNLDKIVSATTDRITMENGDVIPISTKRRSEFKKILEKRKK